MQFVSSMFNSTNYKRTALLLLLISFVAVGGLLVSGSAIQKERFTMAEAVTVEANSKRIRAKAGFELVVKDKNTVVARKTSKNTMSVDARVCACTTGSWSCFSTNEGTTVICGVKDSSACCKWIPAN